MDFVRIFKTTPCKVEIWTCACGLELIKTSTEQSVMERERAPLAKRSSAQKAPSANSIDATSAREATGTENPVLMLRLVNQAIAALWFPVGASEEDRKEHMQSAIALLQGIRPANEIEGMLATQMVATHSAALECLRRAMIPSQTFAGFEQSLKHAAKLMLIYARQVDALNKHRGKGQQKVTVEYVNVEAGGQAVVGHVDTAPNSPRSSDHSVDAPKAIVHTPGKTFETQSRTRVPAKKRKK